MAGVAAAILTGMAWKFVMIYKAPSPQSVAVWLPFVFFFRVDELSAICLSVLQFPLLSLGYLALRRRMRWHTALGSIAGGYAILVAIGLGILEFKSH